VGEWESLTSGGRETQRSKRLKGGEVLLLTREIKELGNTVIFKGPWYAPVKKRILEEKKTKKRSGNYSWKGGAPKVSLKGVTGLFRANRRGGVRP